MKIAIKSIVAVLIVPVVFGITYAFYNNLVQIPEFAHSLKFFAWGIVSYMILHLIFYKPTYLYVLGHEAVHAGVSWVMGGKVNSFKVSNEGGSVGTDKSNFIIELSPYFVPVYAIIITLIYFVISSSYVINGAVFIFLIGFALAFHIISTIEVMKIRQPDIVKSGYFFSIVLVYCLNIVVVAAMFALMFPSFSIKKFFIDTLLLSKYIYIGILKQLFC